MGSENEKKSKLKKIEWAILILCIILLLAGGGTALAFLIQEKQPTIVSIVFDPVKIVETGDETHLFSADRYTFNLTKGSSEQEIETNVVNEQIKGKEQIKFSYVISNSGPETIYWALNLSGLENSGFQIQFDLNNSGFLTDLAEDSQIYNISLASGASDTLEIYFFSKSVESASVSGAVVLTVSMA